MKLDSKTFWSLIDGVTNAAKAAGGGSERNVITFISRPLWRRWNATAGHPPDDPPTAWGGPSGKDRKATRWVFGSETVVVESDEYFAVSFPWNGVSPQSPPAAPSAGL